MSAWELAQLNIAVMKEPLEAPGMADFMAQLDRINALAGASPGFVWRLQSDCGNADQHQADASPLFIVNMSVWNNAKALFDYVYRSDHRR